MDKGKRTDKMCEMTWDFANKIISDEMSYEDLYECFGTPVVEEIFTTFTYKEALKRYIDWNNRDKLVFEIGDEVYTDFGEIGVVSHIGYITDDKAPVVLGYNGNTYGYIEKSRWHKTGRKYMQFVVMLDSLCNNREKLLQQLRQEREEE